MLDQLLGAKKSDLVSMLVSKLGVSDAQAGGFLGSLFERIEDLLKGGNLDVQKLLSGDVSALKSGLNMEALGGLLGGGADKAEEGLEAVAGPIASELSGSKGMLDQLEGLLGGDDKGGMMGAAKGLAGKFFK